MTMEVTDKGNVAGQRPSELLKRKDAADWLNISLRKLDDLVQQGVVPSVKLGRRRLFHPVQLRLWLQQLHDETGAV